MMMTQIDLLLISRANIKHVLKTTKVSDTFSRTCNFV